jgi:alkyl sulfatase BDS1-like metallo-beta-lactamase superfamily hydrolase
MGNVREHAERLWGGATSTAAENPLTTALGLEEYAPGVAFVSSFGNVVALDTGEGLVLFDTSSFITGPMVHAQVRAWSARPLRTVVYTHGHVDHVMGVKAFEQEERPAGWAAPEVVAHEAVAARFDRYQLTAGYNGVINARQFGLPGLRWPTGYRYPDRVYRSELTLEVGGERIELRHARGETDDHTWAFLPGRRALVTGDLFIWAAPNCGNPQKVQRYPREWAAALRVMAALAPEVLFPGHGPPIEGAERVRQALMDSAELLDVLHDGTVALMNEGAPLDVILERVRAPERLLSRPWLRPVYDEPEFIVRNTWRLYGGWWDGNPAHLKPAREDRLAGEVARLCGGAGRLLERAEELSQRGEHALACHLAEWAGRAAPGDEGIRRGRAAIYVRRAGDETSLMAKGIFTAAAADDRRR